jgi:hypothetical protein
MKLHPNLFSVILAVCVVGCTPKAPAIEVMSADFDLNPLVGEWRGTYTAEVGRSGTIAFTLRAGETAAFGRVVMMPQGVDTVATASSTGAVNAAVSSVAARQALTVSFVRKDGGKLLGTLDPYTDPDCNCTVKTTFQGSFTDAKTIEGTFTTTGPQNVRPTTGGTWKVTRLRKL